MKFILNLLWQHAFAAIVKNWGWTLSGLIGGILVDGPELGKFFTGHQLQDVDYQGLWKALVPILLGAFGKSGINLWSLLTGFVSSAPRAQLVIPTKPVDK